MGANHSKMKKKQCLKCGEPIINRKALYCSPKCSTYMGNKILWLTKHRVSDCCSAKLDIYPDENGKLQFKCLKCSKFTNPSKIFFPAFLDK